MSHQSIRAFVAIPLPAPCQAELEALQHHLRGLLPDAARAAARWVRPHQMHLTLKFLGDVEAERVEEIAEAMQAACDNCTSFQLALAGTGCFPNCRKPRVLWAGVGGDIATLMQLQARIEPALAPLAAKSEVQAFRPHLTLARVQTRDQRIARRIGEVLTQSEFSFRSSWQVHRVLLIRSRLLPGGSEYSELASCVLPPSHSGA